jgi:hypothetical protein
MIVGSKIFVSLLLAAKPCCYNTSGGTTIGKMDYSTLSLESQQDNYPNTMEYNYITAEKFIKDNNKKYQDDFR